MATLYDTATMDIPLADTRKRLSQEEDQIRALLGAPRSEGWSLYMIDSEGENDYPASAAFSSAFSAVTEFQPTANECLIQLGSLGDDEGKIVHLVLMGSGGYDAWFWAARDVNGCTEYAIFTTEN